ncbi:MAG: mercury(II) reductase [Bacteroidetes bacterium]|nr:mercury(II) reductase [Bacteroidota bacterium]
MKTLICPTCNCSLVRLGIEPDKAATYSHNGEKLYFCCQGCADLFITSTDPQKYLDEIKNLTVCPTCLAEKPPEMAVKLEIAGHEAYFCRCPDCHQSFRKKPDFYIRRLEGKVLNEGIVLDHEGLSVRPETETTIEIGGDEVIADKGKSKYDYDLIIVGGGSAAVSASIRADELGLNTLIVNKGLPFGGTCVNVGCVPSKHLIRAAESIHCGSNSPFEGIQPNKPTWDYKKIIQQKKKIVGDMQQKKYLNVVDRLEHVTIEEGFAEFVEANSIQVNGNKYQAEKFIIATGATTKIPPVNGLNEVDYLNHTSIFDLEELPESLTILGGGYIASEIAQAYHRFGSQISIIQRSNHILSSQTSDVSEELEKHFQNEGIKVNTGINLERVYRDGNLITVEGKKGSENVTFQSTHILVATGIKPNTYNMGLEKIGVELEKGGHVKVNEILQSSLPNILAVGDCINTPPYVYTAALEGSIAVENAFYGTTKQVDYTALPWVIFTDPQVAGVGMDEKEAEALNIPYDVSTIPLSEVPRSIAALNTKGFIKLIRNPETDKLIGARIVATEGGELAMELSLAIKYGIPVKELSSSFHPFLTLSEGIKLAAITFKKDVAALSCCAS